MLTDQQIDELKNIRHKLHASPEIAGEEKNTAAYIKEKLQSTEPDKIIDNIGGYGLIAIYESKNPGKGSSLMIRAEMDGLAIEEQNDLPYASENKKRMHACGHDGHMAILLGVAKWLKDNRPEKGRVILLFQPAEETGEGSVRMLSDNRFKKLEIDRGIALHNLPGYKKNTIYVRDKTFALASVGMQISFKGKPSHAAYPEEGINPSVAISNFILELEEIKKKLSDNEHFKVLTITYVKVGNPSYGMSPGHGEVGVTIRAENSDAIDNLCSDLEATIENIRENFPGEIHYEKKEPFAATINDKDGIEMLNNIVKDLNLPIETLNEPIGWSEDFGEFRKKCPITIFGLGVGESTPPLHSERYDFEDDLIPTGVSIFCEWTKNELNGR